MNFSRFFVRVKNIGRKSQFGKYSSLLPICDFLYSSFQVPIFPHLKNFFFHYFCSNRFNRYLCRTKRHEAGKRTRANSAEVPDQILLVNK